MRKAQPEHFVVDVVSIRLEQPLALPQPLEHHGEGIDNWKNKDGYCYYRRCLKVVIWRAGQVFLYENINEIYSGKGK